MDPSSESERENRAQYRRMVRMYRRGRPRTSEYARIIPRLMDEFFTNDERFNDWFGMEPLEFEELHRMLETRMRRTHTTFRNNIGTRERLAICLRYLTSGKSAQKLSMHYNLPLKTIPIIIREVCATINQRLMPMVMPGPSRVMWEQKARYFKNIYDVPNCIGALEGKNLQVNGKKIVLLAIVDARERFVMVDVGYYRNNRFRGNVMENSRIGKLFLKNKLGVPPSRPAFEGGEPLPFMLLGSSYFPPTPYMMTKFSKPECNINDTNKIFNTRISRAKLTANRVLMRLRIKWGVFHGPVEAHPSMVESIVLTCCCLHNFFGFRTHRRELPEYPDSIVAVTEDRLQQLQSLIPSDDKDVRNKFKRYFLSPAGQVPWQWDDVVE